MADEGLERFHPTSGRFSGVVGLLIGVVLVGSAFFDDGLARAPWLLPAGLLAGLLSWTMLLRPRVSLTADELVLRQPFSTQTVPLGAITSLSVHRILECRVGEERYVSAAVGRSPRQAARDRDQPVHAVADRSYADFVEQRIESARRAARAPAGPTRRTWAWPEIAATALSTVALVVTVLV